MTVAQPMREQTLLRTEILTGTASRSLSDAIAHQGSAAPKDTASPSRHLGPTVNSLPFKLSILMLAHNAEATIIQAIREILNVDYSCAIELIAVDDGSTDGTYELLSQIDDARLIIYRHETNQGKGTALLSAARLATGSYVLLFAADLSYSAEDIPRLLAPVLADRCRVVYGTLLRGYHSVHQSYRYARGNRLLTWLANILFDACISDLHARVKLIPSEMLNDLALREPGPGFDTKMTALLLKRGIRPFEVPISYHGGPHRPGGKISWRATMAYIGVLLRVRMRRHDGRRYDTAPDRPVLSEAC